jgi:hypothetical protein
VATGDPLELIAEVTIEGASAIGLVENSIVWVSIKATEIDVRSAAGANALGSG